MRIHNFSAGPAALPESVLVDARNELMEYKDAGASVMEISHRSTQYTALAESAKGLMKSLLGLGDDWHVLFLQGGASQQFFQVPLNFLGDGHSADYVNTGVWSKKAIAECKLIGNCNVAASSAESGFDFIPAQDSWSVDENAVYTHFTSNNTIHGTEYHWTPDVPSPLVCDASSNFLSKPIDRDKYGLIYAGAQKNIGPAGSTVVLIRDGFLKEKKSGLPTLMDYGTHTAKLFHTPPVFVVYIIEKVLRWLDDLGGLAAMQKLNEKKSAILYSRIDKNEFYHGTARKQDRSHMNVTFRLQNEALEAEFIAQALTQGLSGLKGHRSVGGIRASIYNACPEESVTALVDFMDSFEAAQG